MNVTQWFVFFFLFFLIFIFTLFYFAILNDLFSKRIPFIIIDESESCSVVSDSLWPHSSWDSPGQSVGVGSLFLLQRIFPKQGLNSGLLYRRQILYQLSRKVSPRILELVAYPFSSGSSQPRNWTGVSCIAGDRWTPKKFDQWFILDWCCFYTGRP